MVRDKKSYIMIHGSITEEEKTFLDIYVPNVGTSKHRKQIWTDLNGEIDSNTIVLKGFNIPSSTLGKSYRQKNH